MMDNGCTFDTPAALSSIYRMLDEVEVPVFMAGNVTSFVGPPPDANPLLFPPGTVGDGSSATDTSQKRSYDSMVGSDRPANSSCNDQSGMLPVPTEFRSMERNYLGLQTQLEPVSRTPQQQAPRQQQAAQQQQHGHYGAPPPPCKQQRLNGTDAIRSVFKDIMPVMDRYGLPQSGSAVGDAWQRNLFSSPHTGNPSQPGAGPSGLLGAGPPGQQGTGTPRLLGATPPGYFGAGTPGQHGLPFHYGPPGQFGAGPPGQQGTGTTGQHGGGPPFQYGAASPFQSGAAQQHHANSSRE